MRTVFVTVVQQTGVVTTCMLEFYNKEASPDYLGKFR